LANEQELQGVREAVGSNPEEAVRLVVEDRWTFSDALKWFQETEEQKGIE
jgi:hypothetical protein